MAAVTLTPSLFSPLLPKSLQVRSVYTSLLSTPEILFNELGQGIRLRAVEVAQESDRLSAASGGHRLTVPAAASSPPFLLHLAQPHLRNPGETVLPRHPEGDSDVGDVGDVGGEAAVVPPHSR